MLEVHGFAAPGWEAVAEAFERNFELSDELGAACCLYVRGEPVVDLWAGIADRETQRSWQRETIVVTNSTTKGATAICAHILADRGELDLDAPVARYWPEFAANGKQDIRVRWLLSHQAGLPVVDSPLTLEDACAWEPVIHALERQPPMWEPGTQQSYHGRTYGFLVGEVIRRVAGKTVGRFFADEVAAPLGLNAWLGLPAEMESRVAPLDRGAAGHEPEDRRALLDAMVDLMLSIPAEAASIPVPEGAREAMRSKFMDRNWALTRSVTLGGAFSTDALVFNLRMVHAAEIPSSGLLTDARSLARMYAATIGDVDGVRLLSPHAVQEMCTIPQTGRYDFPAELEFMVGSQPFPLFSYGFMRPAVTWPLLGPTSFGHAGAGGSLGFADPEAQVGFGYVMDRMADDRNARRLVAAVAECLD